MAEHPLQGAFDRLGRGVKLRTEIERKIIKIGQRYHDATGLEHSMDGSHARLRLVPPPKSFGRPKTSIPILTGEAIQNYRVALEYLVFELAILDCGRERKTKFPIFNTRADFTGQITEYLPGINPTHRNAIEQLQPYNGYAWAANLRDLSNRDKHRKLLTTFRAGRATAGFAVVGRPVQQRVEDIQSVRYVQATGGPRIKVYLQTSALIRIAVKDAATARGEKQVLVRELLADIETGVRNALTSFKPAFPV